VDLLYQHVKEHRSFSRKSDAKITQKKVSQILYLCRRGAYKNIGKRGIKLLDEGIKRGIKQERSRQKKVGNRLQIRCQRPLFF
jgi:hypothetical protein